MTASLTTRALGQAALLVGLGVLGVACPPSTDKVNDSEDPNNNGCSGPVANAGADGTGGIGATITLDGSASTVCDAASAVYIWSVESVPGDSDVDGGDLDLSDPAAPKFVADAVGTYVFSLVVSDSSGVTSAADLVVVTIEAGSSPPVASCGGNQSVEVGDRVNLDGTDSMDPEGAALTYNWALASVPDCSGLGSNSVFNADQSVASFVPDCAATYVVGLAVSDGESWSDPAYCSITVGTGNQRPVADAGTSGDLSPCTEHNYELNGYGSYDPEGAALTYSWTLLEAPEGSSSTQANLSDASLPNPVFTWDVTGAYTFELRVTDGTLESAPDLVIVNFRDASENSVPIANAGADQSISRDTECETASYVFTCEDCPAEDVRVDATASADDVDGDDLAFYWSDSTETLTIENPSSPRTTIWTPSFASEYNVAQVRTWDVVLSVSDCADTAQDTVRITYTCTGTY